MSTQLNFRRYARIPFSDEVLVEDGEGIIKGQIGNISLNGILITNLKREIVSDDVRILIRIPQMGIIRKLSFENVLSIKNEGFNEKIFNIGLSIVRRSPFEGRDFSFAGIFRNIEEVFKNQLQEFVNSYSFNIVCLIKLLEKNKLSDDEQELTHLIARILGRKEKDLIELRHVIQRDFQNI